MLASGGTSRPLGTIATSSLAAALGNEGICSSLRRNDHLCRTLLRQRHLHAALRGAEMLTADDIVQVPDSGRRASVAATADNTKAFCEFAPMTS